MKQEGLAFFTDTHLTVAGLIIFFCFFVGLLFWVNRKSSTELYSKLAQMPFKDGGER